MKIVGLTGFAKSGKSTATDNLKKLGGQEVAFAKHLKDVCAAVFGITRSHFDDQAFKEVSFAEPISILRCDVVDILKYFEVPARYMPDAILKHTRMLLTSPRHVAQYVGTEILRAIDTDIHIKMAFKLNQGTDAKFLICSDVRFANELLAVQGQGGKVIGISRKAVTPADLNNLHGSEKEISSLIALSDIHLANEGTIEEFRDMAQWAVKDILKP